MQSVTTQLHMGKLNISQASKLAGVTRKTLYSHIKQGRISVEIDKDGNKVIDTAEILRVYTSKHEETDTVYNGLQSKYTQDTQVVELLKQQIKRLESDIEDRKAKEQEFLNIIKSNQRLLESGQPEQKKSSDNNVLWVILGVFLISIALIYQFIPADANILFNRWRDLIFNK